MPKPIFMATHPRSCSTAFERIFMTRSDLQCMHEPFGDAFYYGPERLSRRYEADAKSRQNSGFHETTYRNVLDSVEEQAAKGKRIFVKDIAYYLFPPEGKPQGHAKSLDHAQESLLLESKQNSNSTLPNPTVIPSKYLDNFHFTFLIRHPRKSIPSFFRCTIPPLDRMTGFYDFMPSEAGYLELRKLFDFIKERQNLTRPTENSAKSANDPIAASKDTKSSSPTICVIDADDLLDQPASTIENYCQHVGLDFDPGMLTWDSAEHQRNADVAFEKWKGFHEDAIGSTSLKPRDKPQEILSREEEDKQWKKKFGEQGAATIRQTVDANVEHYEYLKQYAHLP